MVLEYGNWGDMA